jgi:hypothetical protein
MGEPAEDLSVESTAIKACFLKRSRVEHLDFVGSGVNHLINSVLVNTGLDLLDITSVLIHHLSGFGNMTMTVKHHLK